MKRSQSACFTASVHERHSATPPPASAPSSVTVMPVCGAGTGALSAVFTAFNAALTSGTPSSPAPTSLPPISNVSPATMRCAMVLARAVIVLASVAANLGAHMSFTSAAALPLMLRSPRSVAAVSLSSSRRLSARAPATAAAQRGACAVFGGSPR
jgi:hypothetical protein